MRILYGLSIENMIFNYHKKAEKLNDAWLRNVLDHAADAVFITNPQGHYIYVNKAASALLGYTADELLKMGIPDVVAQDDVSDTLVKFHMAQATGRERDERNLKCKDGTFVPVEIVITRLPQGGVYGSCRDISERKRAELALRESENRFRLMFESTADALLLLDPKIGQFVDCNQATMDMLRCHDKNQIFPLHPAKLSPLHQPDGRPSTEKAEDMIATAMKNGSHRFEWVHCSAYRENFPVEVLLTPILMGEQQLIITTWRDITERKKVESELLLAKSNAEAANADKSRFLAAASHDLRQPIQAINLFLGLLSETSLDNDQQKIIRNMETSSDALSGLLDALLNISRLDAGIVKKKEFLVDLYEIFRLLEVECAPLAKEKYLRFKLFFPQCSLALHTDPSLLLVMLRNIVGNAIRYTKKGGVLVGARIHGNRLIFQVWDTGIGITPEHLPRIYDEFFQIDNRQRDRTQGLGLGLSIVKRLALLMGYEVTCRSRPGRGTVFAVSLPFDRTVVLADRASPAVIDQKMSIDTSQLSGLHIVLIEDDMLVAEALAGWLRSFGIEVSLFANGRDALGDRRISAADIYISDFRLPGDISGVELLDTIQHRLAHPIKGLIITGDTSTDSVEALASSQWTVFHKPVEPLMLISTIASMWQSAH